MKIKSELYIHRFQEDFSSVSHWSNNNNLAFSVPKFIFLRYHNKFNSLYAIHGKIPFLALIAVQILVSIFLIVYHGDYTIKTLLLQLINLLDYFATYLRQLLFAD